MEIKIYFLEKPVYLCDVLNASHKALLKHPDTVFIDEVSTPAIHTLLHEIAKDNLHAGILLCPDLQKYRSGIFSKRNPERYFQRRFTRLAGVISRVIWLLVR